MMFIKSALLFLAIALGGSHAVAQKAPAKNKSLPALKLSDTNEELNQDNSLTAEVFITRTETQALQALERVLAKNRGTAQEPELLFRIAELHMRRSKSGRFFDLYRDTQKSISFDYPEVKSESAVKSLGTAIKYYLEIETKYPQFRDLDAALFNAAFASSQINLSKESKSLYEKLLSQHPNSPFIPDALLSLGEIEFQDKNFETALAYFEKIEKYKKSKVYSFGLYKSAWTLYNMRRSDEALNKLVQVFALHDPTQPKSNLNLRSEALKDIVLFYSETKEAPQFQAFISKVAKPDEVDESVVLMAKLFNAHSRSEDLINLLSQFVGSKPNSTKRASADILLINTYETLKDRKKVLEQIKSANAACQNEVCKKELSVAINELTKNWWERWSKNKTDKTYSDLALQAFELRLPNLEAKKADIKTTYAYADFLFQISEFEKAKENYLLVHADATVDAKIRHDSVYGAILCLNQKADSVTPKNQKLQLELIPIYLAQFPQGEFKTDLTFKLAELFTQTDQPDLALPLLTELSKTKSEFQVKSQDLLLDLYNQKKDFKSLKEFSLKFAQATTDPSRVTHLTQLQDQAGFAQLQDESKSNQRDSADRFLEYYRTNKNPTLRSQALWKAITIYFAAKHDLDGARTTLELDKLAAEQLPKKDLLKEAIEKSTSLFINLGFFAEAQSALDLKAKVGLIEPKDLDLRIELLALENKSEEAFALARSLKSLSPNDQGRLLYSMLSGAQPALALQIENELNALRVEPYFTEMKVRNLELLLANKKYTEAFNESKAIVGQTQTAPRDMRARARIVQAAVLEKEFIETRTSTSLERLELVLSIKTEKMDKAQQAYLSALKLAETGETKLRVLSGLNRIYTNFIDTVGKPVLKGKVDPDAQKSLFAELAKLVAPIETKRAELQSDLKSLAKNESAVQQTSVSFVDLPTDSPAPTYLPMMDKALQTGYAPPTEVKLSVCKEQSIKDAPTLIAMGQSCLESGKLSVLQKNLFDSSLSQNDLVWVKYYNAIVAAKMGFNEKAIFVASKAVEVDPKNPALHFALAQLYWNDSKPTQSHQSLTKAFNLGVKNQATLYSQLLVNYSKGDCREFLAAFNNLKASSTSDAEQFSPAASECMAQSGEFDAALLAVQDSKTGPLYFWKQLQIGRIHEKFRFDSEKALLAYKKAYASATPEQTEWLNRKTSFLSAPTQKTERLSSTQEGGQL